VKHWEILVTPKCVTTTTSLRSTALEVGKKGEKFSLDFLYGKIAQGKLVASQK
jgi:hypothetical protein